MSGPRPKTFDANHGKVKKSRKHETRVASRLGGRTLPGSGAVRKSKWSSLTLDGDIATADFHIEHKSTEKDSLGLKREWLDKVRRGAKLAMKDPAVVISFTAEQSHPEDWVLIPLNVFERLRGKK